VNKLLAINDYVAASVFLHQLYPHQ